MNNRERPMWLATVRVLGVFLIVFAAGLAVTRAASLMSWSFDLELEQEAAGTAAIAGFASLSFIAGLRMMRTPERIAPRLMVAVVFALSVPLAFAVRGLEPASTSTLTARERAAFDYLRAASLFEMPFVGFAGVRSEGYLAMRILHRSVAADEVFKELVRSGTTAGQLYGLCGLYSTDPLAFALALPRYRASAADVGFFEGCVISSQRVAAVACSDNGMRTRRGTSLEQWFRETEVNVRQRDPDICGGALPAVFSQRDFDERAALSDERRAVFRNDS